MGMVRFATLCSFLDTTEWSVMTRGLKPASQNEPVLRTVGAFYRPQDGFLQPRISIRGWLGLIARYFGAFALLIRDDGRAGLVDDDPLRLELRHDVVLSADEEGQPSLHVVK